ncbi:hypothetical protein A3F29_03255 [Candidatus Roizmanbacteria bacterium RIFCSPHIGHO2_12_FULL_33_9]|uniref:Uncharacterized protein n=1 Tax=Candidatus Roizmanbacteria bacterium RIFCSPHIGHO2_12_FULL_33_9 TaxID=1802045 RepID=A0A1F7HJ38_9BACT|nr:MAG: hypothetical protein A3F29_03255 [Candidatus Roizmanbacteria bacterium RIFCSPHIGHO2_12_FULL_33_9]
MLVYGRFSTGVFSIALIYLKKKKGASEVKIKTRVDIKITNVIRFLGLNKLFIFFTWFYIR